MFIRTCSCLRILVASCSGIIIRKITAVTMTMRTISRVQRCLNVKEQFDDECGELVMVIIYRDPEGEPTKWKTWTLKKTKNVQKTWTQICLFTKNDITIITTEPSKWSAPSCHNTKIRNLIYLLLVIEVSIICEYLY